MPVELTRSQRCSQGRIPIRRPASCCAARRARSRSSRRSRVARSSSSTSSSSARRSRSSATSTRYAALGERVARALETKFRVQRIVLPEQPECDRTTAAWVAARIAPGTSRADRGRLRHGQRPREARSARARLPAARVRDRAVDERLHVGQRVDPRGRCEALGPRAHAGRRVLRSRRARRTRRRA